MYITYIYVIFLTNTMTKQEEVKNLLAFSFSTVNVLYLHVTIILELEKNFQTNRKELIKNCQVYLHDLVTTIQVKCYLENLCV